MCAHYPREWARSDDEHKLLPGVAEFFRTWPGSDVAGWPGEEGEAELALGAAEGGCWTGVESDSADAFPFVGDVPGRPGHVVAAGFNGHGMPRILLSAAHVAPLVLAGLGVAWTAPGLVRGYPPLPGPFVVTAARVEALRGVDAGIAYDACVKGHEDSVKKPFCNEKRCLFWKE